MDCLVSVICDSIPKGSKFAGPGNSRKQSAGHKCHLMQRWHCRHARVDPFMKSHPDANSEPLDIEDLVALGNSSGGPCPYFLSREMASNADIIFMPVSSTRLTPHHIFQGPRMALLELCCPWSPVYYLRQLLRSAVQLSGGCSHANGYEGHHVAQRNTSL